MGEPQIESKVTPEALQIIYLDEIASRLAGLQATMESLELRVLDVHETQKAEIIEGLLEGAEINVTDQLKSVLRESGYKDKWYEITIFNDGLNNINISSTRSKHTRFLILKKSDQIKLTAKTGTKRTVWVWCNKGESATIRVGFER